MGYVGWGLVAEQANTTTGGAQRTVGITSSPGAGIAQSSLNSVNNGGGGVVNNYGAVWDNLFVRQYLFGRGEQGAWFDPSDFQPNWRRNLLTYTEQFDNAVWTKSNSFIQTNLLTWSEQFDNAAWTKSGSTAITPNSVVAPDGTLTADTLSLPTGGGVSQIYQVTSVLVGPVTTSVWVRADAPITLKFGFFDSALDVTDINVTTTWQRFTWTRAAGMSSGDRRACWLYNGVAGAATVYIWGAQLVQGSVPGDYQQTTSAAAAVQYSAPDGTITAEKLAEDATTNLHRMSPGGMTLNFNSGTTYVLSVYAKVAGRQYLNLNANSAINARSTFDLVAGTVASTLSGTASITAVGGGWYRCVVIGASTTTGANSFYYQLSNTSSSGDVSYTGDGTSGVYIWGAQLEVGSTATAYQPITDGVQDYFTYQPQPILYQDSSGVTPVTALEQPCGLMLDKSKGLQLGGAILSDGRSLAGGAVDNGNGTFTIPAGGSIRFTYPLASLVNGAFYWVRFSSFSVSGGNASTDFCDTASVTVLNGQSGPLQYFDSRATYDATFRFVDVVAGAGATVNITSPQLFLLPGNHAYQRTSSKRPVVSARVNLLTYTEQFDNAVWTKQSSAITVTPNATVAPDGTVTADLFTEDLLNNAKSVYQLSVNQATGYTASVYVKANSGTRFMRLVISSAATDFAYVTVAIADGSITQPASVVGTASNASASVSSIGNGWYRISLSATLAAASNFVFFIPLNSGTAAVPTSDYGRASYLGDGSSWYVWGADLRPADQATGIIPRYQRVGAATSGTSTAAGVADYDSVGFPVYLRTDGIDDAMLTNSIDFSAGPTNPPFTSGELVTNGTFDTNVSGWSVTGTSTFTWSGGGGVFTRAASGENANQSFATVSGRFYKISVQVVAGTNARVVFATNTLGAVGNVIEGAGVGTYSVILPATAATMFLQLTSNANGVAVTYDNISVREIDAAYAPDKVTVFSGVRKLSDAANAILVETSTAASASFPGSFNLAAPNSAAATNYGFRSGGTVSVGINSGGGTYAAPITNVLALIADIGGDVLIGRVNAAQVNSSTGDQGTGNFGNYPLYLFARGGTTFYFTGNFYGLIVRGAQTDTSLITTTEEYIANVTGFGAPVVVGTPSIGVSI